MLWKVVVEGKPGQDRDTVFVEAGSPMEARLLAEEATAKYVASCRPLRESIQVHGTIINSKPKK